MSESTNQSDVIGFSLFSYLPKSETDPDLCHRRIIDLERLIHENQKNESENLTVMARKLRQAKRFLRSNEIGACSYELDILQKLANNL